MRAACWTILAASLCAANLARADDFTWAGYIDGRLIAPPHEVSWLKGGLGKLRFGSPDGSVDLRFADAIADLGWHATPELSLTTSLRIEPDQRTGVDALEAYASYRPHADGAWRWSLKTGAFFPPLSLENNDIGWSSVYTLTPSAINSWVGDELRTIGAEGAIARRTQIGTVTLLGALYTRNDPAGVLIAERGWTLDDRPTGLFETVHEPNASLEHMRRAAPDRTPLFLEIDGRPGWYAGGAWDLPGVGHAQFLYYDNDAMPTAHESDYFTWHTQFWSEGVRSNIGDATILFQNIAGSTTVEFRAPSTWTTNFWSSYALASYDLGDWRLSLRGDLFGTAQDAAFWNSFGEHGRAVTASVAWAPLDWLKLTAELIALDATRLERVAEGLAKEEVDDQFQLSARVSF